jgi:DNA-binding NtrC family response regulator
MVSSVQDASFTRDTAQALEANYRGATQEPSSRRPSSGGDSQRVQRADRPCVLVADDDASIRRLLASCLEAAGYRTIVAADGSQALAALSDDVTVAIFDLLMPGATGQECLEQARLRFPDMAVMVVSGHGDIEDAVEAMRCGAFTYLSKPIDRDELLAHVAQAVRTARLARDNRDLRQAVSDVQPPVDFIAGSGSARLLLDQIRRIAQLDASVLLTGASGTGKTILARLIHQAGPRAVGAFVTVNCAAMPRDLIEAELFGHIRGAFTGAVGDRPGRAELADGGTLFLDEVGDLPLEVQPKLLTFLQDRTVQRIGSNKTHCADVRVIAATNHDLATMCREKRFREDLFFRLNVLSLRVPTLAERMADMPALVRELLLRISRRRRCVPFEITADALAAIERHNWPGNVRELENVLERATAFCDRGTIAAADLSIDDVTPAEAGGGGVASLAGLTLAQVEGRAILDTLRATGGNKAKAARQLAISEKSIYNKIKRLKLAPLL